MSKRFVFLIPLFVGIAMATALGVVLHVEQQRFDLETHSEVLKTLTDMGDGIQDALTHRLQVADMFRSSVILAPDMPSHSFAMLAREFSKDLPGIKFMGMARNDTLSHLYPPHTKYFTLGTPLLSTTVFDLSRLIKLAKTTQQPQLAMPSARSDNTLTSAVVPVFLPNSNEAKPNTYWGAVILLIDTPSMLREAGVRKAGHGLHLGLRANDAASGKNHPIFGDQTIFGNGPVYVEFAMPDGFWQLGAYPVGGWPTSPNWSNILLAGCMVILFTVLFLFFILSLLQRHFEQREQYGYVVRNARAIIVRIDLTGSITFCNDYAETFYGYEPGELDGKPLVGSIIPETNLEGESNRRHVMRLLSDPGKHPFYENANVRKRGELVWVSWANKPIYDKNDELTGLLCVGTDITDRKIMEEALRNRERQHALLTNNIPDIIVGLDADMRVTFITPSDMTLRGYPPYEVLGLPLTDFLTTRSGTDFDDAVAELLARHRAAPNADVSTLDLEFTCADGSTIWLETHLGLLLNEDSQIIGIQGVARDITDRKLAETLREDMERMARHDLKTPLAAVVGLPDEIRMAGKLNQSQLAMLDTIEQAGETMLHLINHSLDLFKMESGTYPYAPKTVDALKVLERIRQEIRILSSEKGVSMGFETFGIPDGVPFEVQAEEPLFQSMLSNLILNAVEASPPGSAVTVALNRDTAVSITICNKGEVPPEVRDTFFDKYSTSDAKQGSGIGTYSARLMARTHGGSIHLNTSIPGETSVIVTLPLRAHLGDTA